MAAATGFFLDSGTAATRSSRPSSAYSPPSAASRSTAHWNTLLSLPPVETMWLSSWVHRTLVTWDEWPEKAEDIQPAATLG